MTIRILLADDHKMFREALRIPLEMENDLQVVGEAGSGTELFARLQATTPDVVVLDINLPGLSIPEFVAVNKLGNKFYFIEKCTVNCPHLFYIH